ncbi:MAG: response regulator, partial [Deltaproteobacteria bacterium]
MPENTVLFVDDEKNILNSLSRLFRKEGYNILTAESGKDGLILAAKNELSLIVSDHRMPEMEGVEFLSKVRPLAPDAPRFMLTGFADINAVMAAINKGEVSRFITKPWNDEELRLLVRDGVERYGLVKENK